MNEKFDEMLNLIKFDKFDLNTRIPVERRAQLSNNTCEEAVRGWMRWCISSF